MNKITTPVNKPSLDWKDDVLYPISLFSVACLILLLSSFGTKANIETANASNLNSSTIVDADFEKTDMISDELIAEIK
jgi:hypothetical protein